MNHEPVYRTAPATPGLLTTGGEFIISLLETGAGIRGKSQHSNTPLIYTLINIFFIILFYYFDNIFSGCVGSPSPLLCFPVLSTEGWAVATKALREMHPKWG